MKNNKSKKDKIRLGNQRDFDLLYDTLLSGGTYSDYRSELLDRSMPQERPLGITEDDILAAWILDKDDESELYARGGYIHQGLNSNLYRQQFGGTWDNTNFDSGSTTSTTTSTTSSPSTGSLESIGFGGFDIGSGLSSIATPAGQLVDNTIVNWLDTGNYGDWKTDIQGTNIDPLARLAGNIGGVHTDNAIERLKAERLSNDPNFAIGDTASNLSQYYAYIRDRGPKKQEIQTRDWGARIMDNLNASGQGALQGAKFGPWGALIGGIIGGVANIPSQIIEDKNRQKLNNEILKYNIGLDQGLDEFDTNLTNSYKMQLWNQLQQPYLNACGGKMKNKLASGGYINSHYDYITDPLVKVNAGGTHQENPNEGVQTSVAPDGQPNLVEEGETIINNGQDDAYVFSDRIVADDLILKSHLLPNKFAGKTYADISKELDKIIEEHKNDEISKRTFDEMISRLQQAQEDLKYQEKAEEVAKFIDGLSDEEKEQLEQTMVEEAQAEQRAAEEQAIAEQQAQEQVAQEQQMQPEQAPEQVAMELPEEQIVPSRYDQMMSRALFADAANQGMFQLGGIEKIAADTYFYTTHPKTAFNRAKKEYNKQDLQFKNTSYGQIVSFPIPSITDAYENIKDRIDDYKALKSILRLVDYETDRLYERLPKKHVSDYVFDFINNLTGYPTISDNKKSNGGHLHQDYYSDATSVYNTGVTPQMRIQALNDRQRKMNEAWEQGLPYYENVDNGFLDEFFTGRKLRLIDPDGTETIIDNAWIDDNGQMHGLITGIAPTPSGKNGIWSNSGKMRNMYNFQKGKKVVDDTRKSINASRFANQTKQTASNVRTAQQSGAWRETGRQMGLVAEQEMASRGIQEGLTYSKPSPAAFDYRYGVGTSEYIDPNGFKGVVLADKAKRYAPWLMAPGAAFGAGTLIYGAAGGFDESSDNNNQYHTYTSGKFVDDDGYIRDINGNIIALADDNGNVKFESRPDLISPLNTKHDERLAITTSENNSNNIIRLNSGISTPTTPIQTAPETTSTPYSNPHVPNYKIFGLYVPGLTPYEYEGSLLGYTDPFGKFVPIGGKSDFGDTVNSKADEINGVDTTTSQDPGAVTNPGKDKGNSEKPSKDYSTWLRYAPAIGSGIQYLSDLFGITNRNDYTNANMFQRSISAIPNVNFVPLGNYMTYSPLDETYQQNVARSQYNAARRAAINNASGNAGAALAAINSISGNMNNTFGDLALQAREYNDKQREAVEQFNANIARINSMMSLSAQEKNQAIAAEKARLTYNLANMRENIQNMNDAAKSANENTFYNNLGAIGKENFNMQMVRTNPAFYYTIMSDGSIVYKNGFYDLNQGDQDFITADAEKAQKEQLKKNSEDALNKSEDMSSLMSSPLIGRYFSRPGFWNGYQYTGGLTNNRR